MTSETWRVVLADGSVREVRVEQIPSGRWAHWWHVVFDAMPPGGGTMPATVRPAGAVLGAMWTVGWDVREMLAPGEPTRAELIAQRDAARAELDRAERNRESASNLAGFLQSVVNDVAFAAGARDHETTVGAVKRVSAQRDAAWREGAEAMRREIDGAVMSAAAWADYRSQQHASPDDDEDATHAQAHALDTVLAAIRALPLPARPEVPRG